MDYINILQYERWRKRHDSVIERNTFEGLDSRVVASLKPVMVDGFLKQKIVGGKEWKSVVCVSNGSDYVCVKSEAKSHAKPNILVFTLDEKN